MTGNHVAYRRFQGRKSTPEEITTLYQGLQDSGLADFDVLLSGYCPSAGAVAAVGDIALDLRQRAAAGGRGPGAFFWVLDPVMGDGGRLYVPAETVPVYKKLLAHADLILPNQTEAELLVDIPIRDRASLASAIAELHHAYGLPHVLITSIRLPAVDGTPGETLSIIGSTATADGQPRLFEITVPALPVTFSGTGDMFAALLIARLRQEVARVPDLLTTKSWRSPDDVSPQDLPLARAARSVLASMNAVLADTAAHYRDVESKVPALPGTEVADEAAALQRHLRLTRAAEVRIVRNIDAVRNPPRLDEFTARAMDI